MNTLSATFWLILILAYLLCESFKRNPREKELMDHYGLTAKQAHFARKREECPKYYKKNVYFRLDTYKWHKYDED